MINYDSDGDKILSSSDIQEDNIDRIQAKLKGVSTEEFAEFVDFVNGEFQKNYNLFNDLNAQCVKLEKFTKQELITLIEAHNALIKVLVERQFGSRVTSQQYVDDLNRRLLD